MSFYTQITILAALAIVLSSQSLKYERVFLTEQDELQAVCLDGSPGAHYIYKGDPNKVAIYFQGGGWCGELTVDDTLESCHRRSRSTLGSSNFTVSHLDVSQGIGSGHEQNYFKNWTKVIFIYCDGATHQGYRKDPIEYKGDKIYFKGQRMTRGHFNSLEKSIGLLSKVENIVLSGSSAGGSATYLWLNWLRDNAKAKNIWGVIDSGIFLNQKNALGEYTYEQRIKTIAEIVNSESPPPCRECAAEYQGQVYKCFFAQNSYKYLRVPIFNIQSQYDSWSIPNILGVHCLDGNSMEKCNDVERERIEDYHQKMKALIEKMNHQLKDTGAWAPVCANHIYIQGKLFSSQLFKVPHHSTNTPTAAIKKWLQKEPDEMNYAYIDQGKWPQNKPCSGIQESTQQVQHHISKLVRSIMKKISIQQKQQKNEIQTQL